MLTELQIREIVKDEVEKILSGGQENCLHSKSGSYQKDGSIVCDDCRKKLTKKEKY